MNIPLLTCDGDMWIGNIGLTTKRIQTTSNIVFIILGLHKNNILRGMAVSMFDCSSCVSVYVSIMAKEVVSYLCTRHQDQDLV